MQAEWREKSHPAETPVRIQKRDAIIDYNPEAYAECGELLSAAMATNHIARQVVDLPKPGPLIVTQYRARGYLRTRFGQQTWVAFPGGVTARVQHGQRIGTLYIGLKPRHAGTD